MADVREIIIGALSFIETEDADATRRIRERRADAILAALSSAGFAVFKLGDIKLIQSQCGIPDAAEGADDA